MPRLELFPFRYRHHLTGKGVKGRYVAEQHEIAARYVPPLKLVHEAEPTQMAEQAPEMQPHLARPPAIDGLKAFWAALFLPWYVTHRARLRRYSQMRGASQLHREITETLRRSYPSGTTCAASRRSRS